MTFDRVAEFGRLVVMHTRNWLGKSAALIAAATLALSAHAQDGAYDPSFGSVGRTWFDVTSSTSDNGTKLILLPHGNFFMAGGCGENRIACAIWLTASGTLAAGFGTAGSGKILFSDFTGWPADANEPADAAAFADGRVALAGYKSGGSYLAMLRADGTGLDPAVGNGAGYVSPSFTVAQVRVTAQQQLIVVGQVQASPVVIVVARYDSTLHLDTSFGNGGSTTIGFTGADVYPFGMTLQRDGKIVVIGTVFRSPRAIAIVRLTASGNPDPDFGINSDGRYESSYGTTYGTGGTDIAEDKKGRLVFSGYTRTDDYYGGKWLVNRVLSGGAVDPGFNGGAAQQFTIVSSSTAYSPHGCCVALQADGRIVVAGAIARFLDDGNFDYSYGGGGQSYGDMSTQAPNVISDYPSSMVIAGGGIVVAGATQVNSYEIGFSAAKARIDPLFAADFE
jgi:uncharacterized delta-60 repeat protein